MSNALANLKLIAAKRPVQMSPVVQRRAKVAKRIAEQIALAKSAADGSTYAPTKQRKVKDAETGETKTVEVTKRVKSWAWTAENGKLCVSLRYGAKIVALSTKGQTAVELSNANDLVKTLEALKSAVESGELDQQLEAASSSVKAGFKRKG